MPMQVEQGRYQGEEYTLPKTNIFAPENRPGPKRKVVFQPSIFRGYVSFRECSCPFLIGKEGIYYTKILGTGLHEIS